MYLTLSADNNLVEAQFILGSILEKNIVLMKQFISIYLPHGKMIQNHKINLV